MSKDEKKSPEAVDPKIASATATATREALLEALPLAAGVLAKTLAETQAAQQQQAYITQAKLTGERCQECQQLLPFGMKQGEHRHRQAVVHPKSKRLGRYWQGVFINGVKYMSDNANQKITVPADCNIEYLVSQWERNEEVQKEGREAFHNIGNVNRPNTATRGWR